MRLKPFALLFLGLLACSDETSRPSTPRRFAPTSPRLDGVEQLLSRNGFQDVARIYQGREYDIVSVRVAGRDATASWRRLQTILSPARAWPVILGETDLEESLLENLREAEETSIAVISEQANAIDPTEWLRKRRASDPIFQPPRESRWKRRWRKPCASSKGRGLLGTVDLAENQPYERVSIVVVPTDRSWAVPAFLKYGGWNDCPMPAEHVAVLRHWHDTWGTEVATVSSDFIEMTVPHPLAKRKDALAVAEEHFVYSYDIVHQGTNTIDCLADEITEAPYWFFWWD